MNRQFLPALLLLFILIPLSVPQSVVADPQPYIFTDPVAFFSSKYFQIHAISGTISNDGSTYNTSLHPSSITIDTTKEYALFPIYLSPSEDNIARAEFCIPTSYGGATIELIEAGPTYTVKDGAAGYALSVPYIYNNSDRGNFSAYPGAPPTDWAGTGAPSLANASGMGGSLYRVQLAVATEAPLQLRITNYYATSPAVGFDGVDDYVKIARSSALEPAEIKIFGAVKFFSISTESAGSYIVYKKQTAAPYLSYAVYQTFSNFAVRVANDTATASATKSVSGQAFKIISFEGGYSAPTVYVKLNGTYGTNATLGGNIDYDSNDIYIGCVDGTSYHFKGVLYNLTINNLASDVLLINASSYNPTSGLFEDFSGSNNDGTPYGNVEYKCYTGTGFYAPMTFTTNAHSTLTFSDNDSLPALATSYSPLTLNGSLLLNDTTPTMDDWVDVGITIYNSTHITLPITLTQSGVTLNTITYAYFNGSFTLPFTTVQKPYNNLYQLTLTTYYSTLTTVPYSFYITTPYLTFYGFTIYSSTASPTGLGYLSSTGKLQLLASGNLTIVQPSGVQPPDRILINGVPYHDWSYSLDDNSISLTVPASQYTVTVYYKSDITATISIIFAAITLMTTVLIVLVAFLILAFLRQSQNPAGANISLSYETGAAITVIAIILMVGVLIISAIWSAI